MNYVYFTNLTTDQESFSRLTLDGNDNNHDIQVKWKWLGYTRSTEVGETMGVVQTQGDSTSPDSSLKRGLRPLRRTGVTWSV